MAPGKVVHGVQSQEARGGPHQVLSRVAVVLEKGKAAPGAEDAQTRETGTRHGDTHGESQLLELFGAEGAAPLVAQAALALRLKRQLAETVEDVSLVLGPGQV